MSDTTIEHDKPLTSVERDLLIGLALQQERAAAEVKGRRILGIDLADLNTRQAVAIRHALATVDAMHDVIEELMAQADLDTLDDPGEMRRRVRALLGKE